jgi:hypothetical protein
MREQRHVSARGIMDGDLRLGRALLERPESTTGLLLVQWLRFYLLLGDEHILSAPRSAGGGTPPPQRFFFDLRGRGGPPGTGGHPPPSGPSGDPPKNSSADWRPTASKNEAQCNLLQLGCRSAAAQLPLSCRCGVVGCGLGAIGGGGAERGEAAGRWPSASTGNPGPDLSSSWTSWRRRVRTKRPSGTSSPTA